MISVIIPTYNREKLLPRALQSVLAQSVRDFEIIIIDDASTDDTIAVLELYADSRIRYERLSQNRGVDAARNRGLDLALGEFVVFLDSDDEMMPHALERAYAVLKQDSTLGMVIAPYLLDDGTLTSFERAEDGELSFADQLCGVGLRGKKAAFIMMRRSLTNGLRWEAPYLQFIFYRYLAARTRTWYMTEPLAYYHFDATDLGSVTHRRRRSNQSLSKARSHVLAKFLDDFGVDIEQHCPQRYGYYAYGAAVGLLLSGEKTRARTFARAAARSQLRMKYLLFYWFSLLPFSTLALHAAFAVKRFIQTR